MRRRILGIAMDQLRPARFDPKYRGRARIGVPPMVSAFISDGRRTAERTASAPPYLPQRLRTAFMSRRAVAVGADVNACLAGAEWRVAVGAALDCWRQHPQYGQCGRHCLSRGSHMRHCSPASIWPAHVGTSGSVRCGHPGRRNSASHACRFVELEVLPGGPWRLPWVPLLPWSLPWSAWSLRCRIS